MFNVLIGCVICATMLSGEYMQTKDINYYLLNSEQVQVIIDNHYYYIYDLSLLNNEIEQMLKDSYEMPAFGVSIHTETLNAIQKGVWLKLQYNGTQSANDMPFDELLIEVNYECEGFNIIRGNKGIFEGRCYYINLQNTSMTNLYNYLTKIKVK